MTLTEQEIVAEGNRVIAEEAQALEGLEVGASFVAAVRLLASYPPGRVVVAGVGKSGLVAQRIAATLTVTGTCAWYLSPAGALHGDMGKMMKGDILLMVSRSGESDELRGMGAYADRLGLPIVLITAAPESVLAKWADIVLEHSAEEACQYGLTPTSSATQAMVLGDALALALQKERGFGPEQFAALHKSGSLGRRLTLTVKDVMVTGQDVGYVMPQDTLLTAMVRLGVHRGTLIVSRAGVFHGVVTAGDVSRYIKRYDERWAKAEVADATASVPAEITGPALLVMDVITQMQTAGVMALPVLDEMRNVVGMIHLHDALKARVI
ncbi:hypothetical protein LCGC14_0709830 [marine sediment metagenome]|uniref:SIS domain-containing protein n=1 Tax=marine sediment metagenome TaxID=412755 RepID=A0A0F9TN02_9ZZZZ